MTGADTGRGVADDISAANPGAEMWSSSVDRACSARPRARRSAAPSRARPNFLIWWDADETRELEDGTSITKLGGEQALLTCARVRVEQRHQVDARADRRPARRLARGGHLARDRQQRAAHLHDDRRDHAAHLHADARPAVPRRHLLAERRLQPAAAPELPHRQRHGGAAHARHSPQRDVRSRQRAEHSRRQRGRSLSFDELLSAPMCRPAVCRSPAAQSGPEAGER